MPCLVLAVERDPHEQFFGTHLGGLGCDVRRAGGALGAAARGETDRGPGATRTEGRERNL